MRALLAVAVALVASAGCVDLIPSPEVRHDIKDIGWKAEAKKWAGTYAFTECATTPPPDGSAAPCWKYVFAVDGEADAMISVDGPQPPPRAKALARVHKAGKLDFVFSSYPDEGVDVSDLGPKVFEPFRGRYTPGQTIAFITRDASGRPCLTFDGMTSKLGSKAICASP